ncbi:MAG: hypothetical protein GKR87_01965 [Kiritimatiellae bacterium]|nr:hypothetical protein [Kiritimatiellia bacterium]
MNLLAKRRIYKFLNRWWCLAVFLLSMHVSLLTSKAEGLRNPPPGAFGISRAGAKIVHVEDPTAVFINPANIVDIKNTSVLIAPMVVYVRKEFNAPDGRSEKTTDPWKWLGSVFVTHPLKDGQVMIGMGISEPFGQSIIYDEDNFSFKYITPYSSELDLINLNPTIAMKVGDTIQLGVGVDVVWSEIELKQHYPWFNVTGVAGTPDGSADSKGDGYGLGWNAGVTWLMTDRQALSATIRSSYKIDYDGDFRISNIPGPIPGVAPRSDFHTEIEYPTIASLGYGVNINDTFSLGIDVEWLEWSTMDRVIIDVNNNDVLFPTTTTTQNWKDTWTVGFGGDWKISPTWTARGSYWFLEGPAPEQTQIPILPESDQHALNGGLFFPRIIIAGIWHTRMSYLEIVLSTTI